LKEKENPQKQMENISTNVPYSPSDSNKIENKILCKILGEKIKEVPLVFACLRLVQCMIPCHDFKSPANFYVDADFFEEMQSCSFTKVAFGLKYHPAWSLGKTKMLICKMTDKQRENIIKEKSNKKKNASNLFNMVLTSDELTSLYLEKGVLGSKNSISRTLKYINHVLCSIELKKSEDSLMDLISRMYTFFDSAEECHSFMFSKSCSLCSNLGTEKNNFNGLLDDSFAPSDSLQLIQFSTNKKRMICETMTRRSQEEKGFKPFKIYLVLICSFLAKTISDFLGESINGLFSNHQMSHGLMYMWFFRHIKEPNQNSNVSIEESIWGAPNYNPENIMDSVVLLQKSVIESLKTVGSNYKVLDQVEPLVEHLSDIEAFKNIYMDDCEQLNMIATRISHAILVTQSDLLFSKEIDKSLLETTIRDRLHLMGVENPFNRDSIPIYNRLFTGSQIATRQFLIDGQTPKRRSASRSYDFYECEYITFQEAQKLIVGWMGAIGDVILTFDGWKGEEKEDTIILVEKPFRQVQMGLEDVNQDLKSLSMGKLLKEYWKNSKDVHFCSKNAMAYPVGVDSTLIFFRKDWEPAYRAMLFQICMKSSCHTGWHPYEQDTPIYPAICKLIVPIIDKIASLASKKIVFEEQFAYKNFETTYKHMEEEPLSFETDILGKDWICELELTFQEIIIFIASIRSLCWVFLPNNSPSKSHKFPKWKDIDIHTYMVCILSLIELSSENYFLKEDFERWKENCGSTNSGNKNNLGFSSKNSYNMVSEIVRTTVMSQSVMMFGSIGVSLLMKQIQLIGKTKNINQDQHLLKVVDLLETQCQKNVSNRDIQKLETGEWVLNMEEPLIYELVGRILKAQYPVKTKLNIISQLTVVFPNAIIDKKFRKFGNKNIAHLYKKMAEVSTNQLLTHGIREENGETLDTSLIIKTKPIDHSFQTHLSKKQLESVFKKNQSSDIDKKSTSKSTSSEWSNNGESSETDDVEVLVNEMADFIDSSEEPSEEEKEEKSKSLSGHKRKRKDSQKHVDILKILEEHSKITRFRSQEKSRSCQTKLDKEFENSQQNKKAKTKANNEDDQKSLSAKLLFIYDKMGYEKNDPSLPKKQNKFFDILDRKEKSRVVREMLKKTWTDRLCSVFRMIEKCVYKKDRLTPLDEDFSIDAKYVLFKDKKIPIRVSLKEPTKDQTLDVVLFYEQSLSLPRYHPVYKRMCDDIQDTTMMDLIEFWGLRTTKEFRTQL